MVDIQETVGDDDVVVVSVDEAATLLGISLDGVKKMLARHPEKGTKDVKGRWASVQLTRAELEAAEAKGNNPRTSEDRPETALLISLYEQRMAEKDAQIQFLQEQLRTKDSQIERRDQLHALELQQIQALMPPQEEKPPRRFLGFLWKTE
ncbi:MAG: hypothetical protein ACYDBB_26515 [Armatimonadota bacterium]